MEIILRLDDILRHMDSIGHRISFTDDLHLHSGITDITDTVREYRHAMCHVHATGHFTAPDGSPKRERQPSVGFIDITFNVAFGKGVLHRAPGFVLESDYDDDVCFFYGAHRLYIKRHIIRALQQARSVLVP